MGEMFEKGRVFVNNVTEIFGISYGDRFQCPRCKGSGLNSGQRFWNRNQSSPTTESCWFCDGVGVMPVIGLNGFMFGPSKPILNTKDVNPLPELPMKMQLYLGKYPETKCTVKTYKPSMKLSDLLLRTNQYPSWMNGADGEAVFSSLQSSGETSDRGPISCSLISTTTKSSEPSKAVVIQTGNRSTKARVSISSRNLRQRNSSTSRISRDSSFKVLSSQGSPASPPIEQRNNRRAKEAPRRSGDSLLVTFRKTLCTYLSAPVRVSSSPKVHISTRHGVLTASNLGNSKMTRKSPLLRIPTSTWYPRGERNRVREKAEKEAVLRAYKFQKPCISQLNARSSAASESPDSRQSGGDKMEHFTNLSNLSLGATDLINGKKSWRRMIRSSLKISSDSTTIYQIALRKVKDGIFRILSLGKAFQLH